MHISKVSATFVTLGLTALLSTSVPQAASAAMQPEQSMEKETTININDRMVIFSARMSLSYLSGEAGEYVYIPEINHKLSELKWQFEDVYMLGLGASVAPFSWLKLNIDAWFNVNDGENTMDDYDWFIEDFQYTHWSHHEDVDMTKAFMFDASADITFYRVAKTNFFGTIGFKHDSYEWEAFGGDYVYSTFFLYDTVGSFDPNEKVITYEQNYYAPYLGVGFSSNLSTTPMSFSGRLIFAPYVWGDDKDQHHLRNLIFEEDFDSGTMLAIDLGTAYHFTKLFSIWAAAHYQKYDEMKGETTITDTITGEKTTVTGDVAGMDSDATLLTLGFALSF